MAERKQLPSFYGYLMTEEQAEKLSDSLTEDILERYNTPEYLDPQIIEDFAIENKLKKAKG